MLFKTMFPYCGMCWYVQTPSSQPMCVSCLFQVKDLHAKAKVEWKEMEERHHLVQNKVGVSSSFARC